MSPFKNERANGSKSISRVSGRADQYQILKRLKRVYAPNGAMVRKPNKVVGNTCWCVESNGQISSQILSLSQQYVNVVDVASDTLKRPRQEIVS